MGVFEHCLYIEIWLPEYDHPLTDLPCPEAWNGYAESVPLYICALEDYGQWGNYVELCQDLGIFPTPESKHLTAESEVSCMDNLEKSQIGQADFT